jgi:hypothetical protein
MHTALDGPQVPLDYEKRPKDHPNWVRVVPERLIRHDAKYNIFFRGQKCTLFTEEDQEKYGVAYFGPRWDLRYPYSKEIAYDWGELSVVRDFETGGILI